MNMKSVKCVYNKTFCPSNIFNTIHCKHIGNEIIHLNYSQLFVNSMFALSLQKKDLCNGMHVRESRNHHLE